MDADVLAQRMVVRHREPGYLRLELPVEVCYAAALARMATELRQVVGVYRVTVDGRLRRLVVWYETHSCEVATIARRLKACLADLPVDEADHEAIHEPGNLAASVPAINEFGVQAQRALGYARDTLERLRQPGAPAGSMQARLQPVFASALTEKAATNFLNDLVAFYLIKVHWELISKRWLQEPVKHVNAWLTVFYLVFLLVRYRKSINKPAPTLVPTSEPAP
jgi:hypothetical protein